MSSTTTDVLKADRILVEDRIYRLLPIKDSLKVNEEVKLSKTTHFEEDDSDPDVPITHQGDRFIVTIHVPADLMGYVVGTKHKNVEALKNQYGVKIIIPDKKNMEAGITIQGSTQRSVATTYKIIQNKIFIKRMKTDSTHFISFPVNSSNIQESFLKFKDEILDKYRRVRGIDPTIFQKAAKLHVTVTVLVLLDERDKQNAHAILNKCTDSFIKDLGEKEIVVHVKGLEIMNDDPSEVDVLYAKLYEVDHDNRLQILANKIMTEFVDATLSRDKYEEVKLHITLMNTIFREHLENKDSDEEVKNKDSDKRITFDASRIIKDLADYDFGEIVISEIHISTRYTEASDGYYSHIYKIKLN